mgnify:CR=1 FL=1
MNALQRDLKKLVPLVESLGKETVAADPHRQRFHLQPPVGWLNDPNGLCVYGGQYHAFFQYGPFDVNGGVKHWGHAVSTDLLHWEQLPVMLYPDEPFDCHGAYSGSALVEDGTMYLYYTGNVKHPGNFDYIKEGRGHNVCLAVSKDGVTLDSKQCLLTNRDYPAGLTCHVRDPKVFAYEGRYYMVLGARTLEDKGEVLVLESTDKLRWTHINTLTTPEPFGYMWECPDLFCLDGQWYLAVSPQGIDCQNVYGCGWFAIYGDWRGDCTLSEFHELDAGFDYYAPQSFVDGNGRRIQIGWMGMPDEPTYGNAPTVVCGWQHCMTVPRELTAGDGGVVLQQPAREIERHYASVRVGEGSLEVAGDTCFDVVVDGVDGVFTATVDGELKLAFVPAEGELPSRFEMRFTDEGRASAGCGRTVRWEPVDEVRNVRIVGDVSSVEVFVNDGALVFSTRIYPEVYGVTVDASDASVTYHTLII